MKLQDLGLFFVILWTCLNQAQAASELPVGHLKPLGGRRPQTIVILAEYAAPRTTRSVSLEKTQIPTMSLKQLFMLFHIYKCRRFRKSNPNRAPELGISAE